MTALLLLLLLLLLLGAPDQSKAGKERQLFLRGRNQGKEGRKVEKTRRRKRRKRKERRKRRCQRAASSMTVKGCALYDCS